MRRAVAKQSAKRAVAITTTIYQHARAREKRPRQPLCPTTRSSSSSPYIKQRFMPLKGQLRTRRGFYRSHVCLRLVTVTIIAVQLPVNGSNSKSNDSKLNRRQRSSKHSELFNEVTLSLCSSLFFFFFFVHRSSSATKFLTHGGSRGQRGLSEWNCPVNVCHSRSIANS